MSRQCIQQRFGVLEIGGVKALGKPGVDLGQQVVRLLPFPLLLPEPTQTHGSPQLQRFRLLAAGDVQGALQPGFRLLLQQTGTPQAEIETWFQRALDVARRQEAKSLELRAAMSLSRLRQGQGKRKEAHDLLAEVYAWFTEGFDTADLQEAKALLEELA